MGRIRRLLVYTVTIEQDNELYIYFEKWLKKNYNKTYRNVKGLIEYEEYVAEPIDVYVSEDIPFKYKISYKQLSDTFTIRRIFTYIHVSKVREKLEQARDIRDVFFDRFQLTGFFAKKEIHNLLQEVLKEKELHYYEQLKKVSISVYTNNIDYWQNIDDFVPKKFNQLIFDKKDMVLADMRNFYENKAWYSKIGITHNRSYLFYGPPGTGKTTLALALAYELKKDVYIMNCNGITDNDIKKLFRNIAPNSILLLEDIDAYFNNNREANDKTVRFSFSTFLNCLDGIFSKMGLITIFTTNHIDKLSGALKRAGRMDTKIYVGNPTICNINQYIKLFYDIDIDKIYIPFNKKYTKNIPMVDVQEMCIRNKTSEEKLVEELHNILVFEDTKNENNLKKYS